MHDERLVRNAFFCKSGKLLTAEYFKFQKTQKDQSLLEFDMLTRNEIAIMINKFVTHVRALSTV